MEEDNQSNVPEVPSFGDKKFIKVINKGAYGKIVLTEKENYEGYLCTKIMSKKDIQKLRFAKYVKTEIENLKKCHHENILKYIEDGSDKKYIYLTTEYLNGKSLAEILEKRVEDDDQAFNEAEVQHIMRQVVAGLDYLHSKEMNILHRDLKPDNVMLNYPPDKMDDKESGNIFSATVKLIDFGFSRFLPEDQTAESDLGSAPYKDPGLLLKEMHFNKGKREGLNYKYDKKLDIWSLGIMCYELLTGKWTFEATEMEELVKKVELGIYIMPINIHQETSDFIEAMLKFDPDKRSSARELLSHPFLTKDIKDFQCLNVENKKISEGGILKAVK